MHQLGNRELFERNVNIEHQTLYIYFSAILDVPSNEKFVNYLHVTQFVACAEKEVLSELQVHFFSGKKSPVVSWSIWKVLVFSLMWK